MQKNLADELVEKLTQEDMRDEVKRGNAVLILSKYKALESVALPSAETLIFAAANFVKIELRPIKVETEDENMRLYFQYVLSAAKMLLMDDKVGCINAEYSSNITSIGAATSEVQQYLQDFQIKLVEAYLDYLEEKNLESTSIFSTMLQSRVGENTAVMTGMPKDTEKPQADEVTDAEEIAEVEEILSLKIKQLETQIKELQGKIEVKNTKPGAKKEVENLKRKLAKAEKDKKRFELTLQNVKNNARNG